MIDLMFFDTLQAGVNNLVLGLDWLLSGYLSLVSKDF
jgi:hypothetical protein